MDLGERLKEVLLEEKEFPLVDSFLGGYFYYGTPFSKGYFRSYIENDITEFTDSCFRLRSQIYSNQLQMDFNDRKNVGLMGPYVLGALMSVSYMPFDLIHTIARYTKDSRKEKEKIQTLLTSSHTHGK